MPAMIRRSKTQLFERNQVNRTGLQLPRYVDWFKRLETSLGAEWERQLQKMREGTAVSNPVKELCDQRKHYAVEVKDLRDDRLRGKLKSQVHAGLATAGPNGCNEILDEAVTVAVSDSTPSYSAGQSYVSCNLPLTTAAVEISFAL